MMATSETALLPLGLRRLLLATASADCADDGESGHSLPQGTCLLPQETLGPGLMP